MGKELEEYKKNNIDKIRIGACIELYLLADNFVADFDKIKTFLEENENLLNNQNKGTLIRQIEDIKSVLINNIDIITDDLDTNNSFMEYMQKSY